MEYPLLPYHWLRNGVLNPPAQENEYFLNFTMHFLEFAFMYKAPTNSSTHYCGNILNLLIRFLKVTSTSNIISDYGRCVILGF